MGKDPLSEVIEAVSARRISRRRLAVLSNTQPSALRKIFRGERKPTYETVMRLHRALLIHSAANGGKAA